MALLFENPTLEQIYNCSYNAIFSGVLGIGICYALQATAQKYTDPTVAALLMSLESVFAALSGALILHETLNIKESIGVILILTAVVLAQLPEKQKKTAEMNSGG